MWWRSHLLGTRSAFARVWPAALVLSACHASAGSTRVPAPAEPATVAPAAPAPEPAPAASAPAPEPAQPEAAGPVWSTPKDSDECQEYPRINAPHWQTLPTRDACTAWVSARKCRPGTGCFDGTNWQSCSFDGMGVVSTLLASISRGFHLDFKAGSAELPAAGADWSALLAEARRLAKPARRKAAVQAYALPSEAATPAEQAQLAERRASEIVKQLARSGVPPSKLEVGAPMPEQLDGRVQVIVLVGDPNEPMREDFPTNSAKYQHFCGAREDELGKPGLR